MPGVLFNAKIHTLEPNAPIVQAMAWDKEGRIVFTAAESLREAIATLEVHPNLNPLHGRLAASDLAEITVLRTVLGGETVFGGEQ